jgi:hypothetical protein
LAPTLSFDNIQVISLTQEKDEKEGEKRKKEKKYF